MGVCTSQPREVEGSNLKSQPLILEADLALIRQEKFNKLLRKRLGQCVISDFELGKTLGKGSCGTVRLAKHLKSGKNYAVKILSVHQEADLKQAKIESEIMLTIDNHPNIIRLEGICQEELCYYLIQEFAEGGDVFTLLRKLKRFDALSAQFYIAQTVICPHFFFCEPAHTCCTAQKLPTITSLLLPNTPSLRYLSSTPIHGDERGRSRWSKIA